MVGIIRPGKAIPKGTRNAIITIHTAKAGQGATVTAATLATLCAGAGRTLLIDASIGDLPAVLGLTTIQSPASPLTATTPDAPAVDTPAVPIIENLDLLPLGDPDAMPATRDTGLVTGGCDRYDTVIIDISTLPVTGCDTAATMLLVTRPCHLALRRAIATPTLKPAQLERLAVYCPQLAASHDTLAVATAA